MKANNRIIVLSVLVMSLILSTILPGCNISGIQAAEQLTPLSIVLIIGNHGNSLGLKLNGDKISEVVTQVAESYGTVSVVCADGSPEVVGEYDFDIPDQYKNADKNKLLSDARKKAADVLNSLQEVIANDPEIDTLESLWLAVRTLSTASEESQKVIYCLDSGLSTTGTLSFMNNLINVDPEKLADILYARDAIPSFEGTKVIWQHMADVGGSQPKLTKTNVEKLKAIWKAIVQKTGGEFELCEEPPETSENIHLDYPYVSTVELSGEVAIQFDPEETVDLSQQPIFISEDQVQFIGDSAEFLDPESAITALSPIAEYMKDNSSAQILLIGTTAGDENNSYCLNLSTKRANAVKVALIHLGASSKNIACVGLGNSDPWHIRNIDSKGNWIEALAAMNRKVVVLDATSDLAKSLLGNQ